MGRYLLVEFDDNDSANRMRAQIDAAEAKGRAFRVVGMYTKPSTLCECENRSGKSVKGAKFRWYLCESCRRPKPGSPQILPNILDDPETPAKYRDLSLPIRWFNRNGVVTAARSFLRKDWK